jgi:hypothetical protein
MHVGGGTKLFLHAILTISESAAPGAQSSRAAGKSEILKSLSQAVEKLLD